MAQGANTEGAAQTGPWEGSRPPLLQLTHGTVAQATLTASLLPPPNTFTGRLGISEHDLGKGWD